MHTRISSRNTFILRWAFPVAWGGFVVVALLDTWTQGSARYALVVGIALAAMSAMMFLVMRASIRDLVDEVYDEGDHLLVRRGEIEARVPFDNIMNVSFTQRANPSRITLHLVKPCPLGAQISFSPVPPSLTETFSGSSSIGEDLMRRAYSARSRHSG